MRYGLFFSVASAGVLFSQAFAGTMGPVTPKDLAWMGSIAAGPVWVRGGETQTFYLTPTIEKSYVPEKANHAIASGELFVGIQKSLTSQLLGQLGFAVAATSDTRLQGMVWDDGFPEFSNHSYQYKLSSSRVAAKGKLLLDKGYWLMPWISASAGVGFNRSHAYVNTPLLEEGPAAPGFADHTKTTFTYTLGAGVQKSINDHWQMGVGYEFADFGKSGLNRAFEQTLNSGLALKHLYSNGLLFNLTYVA